MQDHELYRRILGIEERWRLDSVELKLDAGQVHVHLTHEGGRVAVPGMRRGRGP